MRLFIFNGPPGSGKSTSISHMVRFVEGPVHVDRVSYPLKAIRNEIESLAGYTLGRESARSLEIDLSELIFKRHFTAEVLGRACARRILHSAPELPATVLLDAGQQPEVEALLDTLRLNIDNIHLVHVSRRGCSFEGDTRGYLDLEHRGIVPIQLFNGGSSERALQEDLWKIYRWSHGHRKEPL